MGYLVTTTGRLRLALEQEGAALAALKEAMAARDGWYDPEEWPVESLDELASFAASATVAREGDWLVLTTDEAGDPKWSDQATAFYVELARWVGEGAVALVGEDDETWGYTYADGLTQSGVNGWDGSAEPFGPPVPWGPGEDPGAMPTVTKARRRWFGRRSRG